MTDAFVWCHRHPEQLVSRCWKCNPKLRGKITEAPRPIPPLSFVVGDRVSINNPNRRRADYWGEVVSVKAWPRVSVKTWIPNAGRFSYHANQFAAGFLQKISGGTDKETE